MADLDVLATGMSDRPAMSAGAAAKTDTVEAPSCIEQPSAAPLPHRRGLWWPVLAVVAVLVLGGGGYWWTHRPPGLPPGIAVSNGRLEADEVDVSTKFPGRVSEILVDEGSMVKAGQVVARMDVRDLQAQLSQANAQVAQAHQMVTQTIADLVQMSSQLKLTAQELDRAKTLFRQGYGTGQMLDQRQSQFSVATATYHSTEAKIAAATAGVEAATRSGELIQVNIADNTLVAPKDGPIEYRLANVGEVLPAGGKVFTMLDAAYVYMDIFLPTQTAGRVEIGDEASIVLDALPSRPIRAKVSFLSAINEFTPKTVETQSERDKLMFRVRVRIDPEFSRAHAAKVRSGLPGLSYIRLDTTPWPTNLQPVVGK